jgi:hypothetical protein
MLCLPACTGEAKGVSRGIFVSRQPSEQVFEATQTALRLVGFSVGNPQQAGESMTVTGQKFAMATWSGPAPVYINVIVTPLPQGAKISVEVIPPSTAYGSSALPFHDYQYAMSLVLPDLKVQSVQLPRRLLG